MAIVTLLELNGRLVRGPLVVALLGVGLGSVGCGDEGTISLGALTASDGGIDSGSLGGDAMLTDAGVDGVLQDLGAADSAGSDVALVETDAAAADMTGATDAVTTATDAVATTDATAGTDAAVGTDASVDPCIAPREAFEAAKIKAFSCKSEFDCYAKALVSPDCTCLAYANGNNEANMTALGLAVSDVKKAKCTKVCAADCYDLTAAIGQCLGGTCQTTSPSCAELDTLSQKALAAGAACTADSDCTFKVSNTLGCGCAAYVNPAAMGPGKPLFLFMTMLVGAYKAKGCTGDVSCECPPAEKGACVAGKCVVAQ